MWFFKQSGQIYLSLEPSHALCNTYNFSEELTELLTPFVFSQNDPKFANVLFALLFELNKADSEFKPYLDILPRQPSTLAYDYWTNSDFIEKELSGMAAKRKAIEFKLGIDRTVNAYLAFMKEHPETFNPDFFTEKNLEWAVLTVYTRLMQVDDQFLLNKSKNSKDREFKLSSKENLIEVDAIQSFFTGDVIIENLHWNNTNLLVYQGLTLRHNTHDCVLLDFSFSENKEDTLVEQRKAFFKRQFDFQGNFYSFIEECLSEENLFPKRLLFFFYTSVLDDKELSQEEPKTTDLEFDRIVIEEGVSQLKAILSLSKTNLEEDQRKLETAQSKLEKDIFSYVIEQKIQLQRVINHYQEKIEEIGREDVL